MGDWGGAALQHKELTRGGVFALRVPCALTLPQSCLVDLQTTVGANHAANMQHRGLGVSFWYGDQWPHQ